MPHIPKTSSREGGRNARMSRIRRHFDELTKVHLPRSGAGTCPVRVILLERGQSASCFPELPHDDDKSRTAPSNGTCSKLHTSRSTPYANHALGHHLVTSLVKTHQILNVGQRLSTPGPSRGPRLSRLRRGQAFRRQGAGGETTRPNSPPYVHAPGIICSIAGTAVELQLTLSDGRPYHLRPTHSKERCK